MTELVLATHNQGKVREMEKLLEGSGFKVLSLHEFPEFPEVVEDGDTFEANAIKKARETAAYTGRLALADDSGLEVDHLGGAPGVYSARFAGPARDDAANNRKLLKQLEGVPAEKRTGRFCCVVAVAAPDGRVKTARGTCEGLIGAEPRGDSGFGYDPLFYVPEYNQTFAQLDLAVKNKISHRGRAFAAAKDILAGFAGV
ncbi:MAG: XTP/dITP diphosphatase [Bacillota bacterium]|jgi:XTP/dITP diphosphohydrolase